MSRILQWNQRIWTFNNNISIPTFVFSVEYIMLMETLYRCVECFFQQFQSVFHVQFVFLRQQVTADGPLSTMI
jgi:hypothetical protein